MSKFLKYEFAVILFAAAAVTTNPVVADTVLISLPPSLGVAQLSSFDTHSFGVDTWSPATTVSLSDGPWSLSTATVSLVDRTSLFTKAPYVAAAVSGKANNSISQPAAFLTYYFEVVGPSSISVAVNAAGSIGASSSGGETANAFMEVYVNSPTSNAKIATVTACTFALGCTGYNSTLAPVHQVITPGTRGFETGIANYSVDFDVASNILYKILIGATADADVFNSFAFAASFVDPTLTISQELRSKGFSFDFSPGIASSVPEPSTWAMMIFGFAGVGFVAYRRRNLNTSIHAA